MRRRLEQALNGVFGRLLQTTERAAAAAEGASKCDKERNATQEHQVRGLAASQQRGRTEDMARMVAAVFYMAAGRRASLRKGSPGDGD